MIEINNNNEYINIFDNISEVVKYVTSRDTKSGRNEDSLEETNDSWYGTRTFEDAVNKITHGDDELYQQTLKEINKLKIDRMLGNVRNKLKYNKRQYGCVPNIPAFLSGNPMNMINPEKNDISHKILNIFLNIRVSGGTSGNTITEIGSKYLAVIDLLEKAGYRCNLYSGIANDDYNMKSLLMVRVKTDKEPFNLKKICFTIANPAMQRRIKFRWMEVNDCKKNMTNGYGGTCFDSDIKGMLDKTKQDYIVWNYERNNNEFKIEDIIKELEEQGIKISE